MLDMRPVREWIAGRRVVCTGGAGFIGSELVRQVMALNPSSVTVIDNREEGLWRIGREVPGCIPLYGDVRSARSMRHLLRDAEIVFHAAAMKHVPIAELAPEDAWGINAAGTRHVVDAARGAAVVLVSTDKAVNPSSVMGRTKRVAEQVVREAGGTVVRFGNVLGSTGSVVPLWREQLAKGGPLTVTDRAMTRFFMSVGEAAELILQAGAMGPGTFVLDMGEAVSVAALAEDFVRLSGRRDIQVVYTGIRPGEKLAEELSSQPLVPSGVDGIFRVANVVAST